jgi:hypothetical protein
MPILIINVIIVVVANTLDKENDMTIRILNHQINKYNIIDIILYFKKIFNKYIKYIFI